MAELTNRIIAISVGLVVAAVLVPLGLSEIANATGLTNVDPAVVTIFQVLLPKDLPSQINPVNTCGDWDSNVVHEGRLSRTSPWDRVSCSSRP